MYDVARWPLLFRYMAIHHWPLANSRCRVHMKVAVVVLVNSIKLAHMAVYYLLIC